VILPLVATAGRKSDDRPAEVPADDDAHFAVQAGRLSVQSGVRLGPRHGRRATARERFAESLPNPYLLLTIESLGDSSS
jgi:hypothetical protein